MVEESRDHGVPAPGALRPRSGNPATLSACRCHHRSHRRSGRSRSQSSILDPVSESNDVEPVGPRTAAECGGRTCGIRRLSYDDATGDEPMPNMLTSRIWIAAAVLGLAATVQIIQAQGPPPPAGGRGGQQTTTPPAGGGRARGGVMGAGPADAPYVDSALADKGRSVWAAECINCHGTQARGSDNGPNLTRSMVVLRDRYGNELGPFLKRGHKMQSGAAASTLSDDQIVNLAHFLRQRVNDSFRG